MYHPTVIAAREATLLDQPSIHALFPRGLTRYAVDLVQQRIVDLEKVLDDKGKPRRALTPDEITQLNKTNAGNFTLAPNKAVTPGRPVRKSLPLV